MRNERAGFGFVDRIGADAAATAAPFVGELEWMESVLPSVSEFLVKDNPREGAGYETIATKEFAALVDAWDAIPTQSMTIDA